MATTAKTMRKRVHKLPVRELSKNSFVLLLSTCYDLPYHLVDRVYRRHVPFSIDHEVDRLEDTFRFRLSIVKQELSSIVSIVGILDFIDDVNLCY
jgi:hypothetical protein